MEINKVRLHTCNQKIEGYIVDKCRCRKFVSDERAESLLLDGVAAHVIKSFKDIEVQEQCPICGGVENFKKRCHLCKNSGIVSKQKLHIEYGEDIYMRPVLKTPRTATIEEEHIEYAYVKGDRDALRRIELYNGLTKTALAQLGAQITDSRTKEVLFDGTPEPEDDPHKQTGRKYDWGRSI